MAAAAIDHPPSLQSLLPLTPQSLCDMLDPARGAVQAPIRSEIFGLQRFCQHGRSLGETHRAQTSHGSGTPFFPRLQSNITMLREAHECIGMHAGTGYDITPAAEWLLDNFHLIEAQLKEIHEGLPRSFFRTLPLLQDAPLAGLPRVYGVAWAFVAHTDGAFDSELLVQFLSAYQDVRDLNLNEMWALPTTLRVVLVENLRRLAERVATNKAARAVANLCFDRIDTLTVDELNQLLDLMHQRGVGMVFLAQIGQRLQDRRMTDDLGNDAPYQIWVHSVLPDLAAQQVQHSADQAADNLSVSNAVGSLRAIGNADWPALIARASALMRKMLTSPVFAAEDVGTRDDTLHAIERLARQSARSELAVGQTLLELMQSAPLGSAASAAGHWVSGSGRPALWQALGMPRRAALARLQLGPRLAWPVYMVCLGLAVAWAMAWLLDTFPATAWTWWAVLPMLFPVSEAVVAIINRLMSESVRPQHLPRLALRDGLPPTHRVLVVVPAMLSSPATCAALVHRLELHYLANPEPQAQFALLSDWVDSDSMHEPSDDVLLQDTLAHIHALNARYPRLEPAQTAGQSVPRFIVLHRQRQWSESEQRWIGWERKRGKLELLVDAVAVGNSTAFMALQENSQLADAIQYIVTLDSDTQLPPGRLRELVGVAAHPHNLPVLNASGTAVVSGYGILQPRISTPLPAVQDFTRFHWLFAGQCGMDPYSSASSEVYQDLFGEGTFTGKGLLNVQALHAVLSGRLPTEKILSHDLLEGAIARCATVSDMVVLEDAPFHADVAASRVHRWTRGDWQLLPLIYQALRHPARWPIRAVNLWKMVDNLRRSLVAPLSLVFLLLALAGVGITPWAALAVVALAFSAGPLMGALAALVPSRTDFAKRRFFRAALLDWGRAAMGGLWHVAQLLQQSLMALDAIGRALYRMTVRHRLLLQWTTAEAAAAQAQITLTGVARQHRSEPLIGLALMGILLALGTPAPVLTVALCLLWGAAPLWTWWVSRTHPTDTTLPEADHVYLNGVARDTWRLFERCVTADEHFLPPDNLQVSPHDMVAHRTSPTNMGLYLLSTACAREFGWIGTLEMLDRLDATLHTLHTLPRYRGHFYNWYDTQTCAPLLPIYVSTVDSGNLSGHLLAVAQACRERALAPLDGSASARALAASHQRLKPLLFARHSLTPALRQQLCWCLADHRTTVRSARRDTLARVNGTLQDSLVARLQALAQSLEQLAWEADYSFLFSPTRQLLHIGYRVAEQQRDASYYDLLASESRLTSLLAIAKGDAPVRHWAALGRPLYAVGTQAALRSWSGSMFEYLMPSLVLDEPHGSLLNEACTAAVSEQAAFGKLHSVPWGISESAYAASDHTLAYQYAPQGVPRLALRRTPADELVIAPYATALAAPLSPRLSVVNFKLLEAMGARARYGFIEALDFTAARRTSGGAYAPVETFMAHHQGMSIVALANTLLDKPALRWGMANAHIEAVTSLLHERVPREVSLLHAPTPQMASPLQQRRRTPGLVREVVPGVAAVEPTHLLSNGRYSVAIRANGSGWSRWGTYGITREHDDALRDTHGSFFYLRHVGADLVSLTQHPTPDTEAHYHSVFHADRVHLEASWPEVQTSTTVWVSPEDDIEFRQVELRNMGDTPLALELVSAMEVTLTDPRADAAHPAFGKLFVRAQWQHASQAMLFERTPRLDNERGLHMAHFLTGTHPAIQRVRLQTDRQHWLGRNHSPHQPLANLVDAPKADSLLDTGLDPVCVLAVQVRIAPHAKVQITFATAASDNPATLRAVVDKYRQYGNVKRASLMSATLAGIRLRDLRISADNFAAMQTLSTALVLTLTRPQPSGSNPNAQVPESLQRQTLWRFGISGDRPLILVAAGVMEGLGLLRALAQLLKLWAWGGIACDVVVVNSEPASYLLALQREIVALGERHLADARATPGQPTTAWYALRADELSHAELHTLRSLARVRLHADGRPLQHHVQEWLTQHEQAFEERHRPARTALSTPAFVSVPAVTHGVFAADTGAHAGEFTFDVSPQLRPTKPWINVLANPHFGCHVSETGGGYNWARNSRLNQLTPWSNDPVADQPSEWFWLQDRSTQAAWSITPNAWAAPRATYHVAHGQGYSRISHRQGDLQTTALWCVDAQTSVKHIAITLHNHGSKTLNLRLVGVVEWMLGAQRADRATVSTSVHRQRGAARTLLALLATQRDGSAGFGQGTAFFSVDSPAQDTEDWTCDRRECFDARGRWVLPDHFGQTSGDGLDPCAALSTRVVVGAGQSTEVIFQLGYADSPSLAQGLASRANAVTHTQRLQNVRRFWQPLLAATTVKTPDPLFDAMVNHWLLYQTVSCRLWAKAGFYQAGGATGFRDQLQDAMALAWAAPHILRDQIVLCAAHQFPEGDVQHWWHAPGGAGVRTHFSDDLLWLVHATHHYLYATGDTALLDESVPFLEGAGIPAGAEDAYYVPTISTQEASVYEHCARTLDRSLRVGVHGLPLMGSGDWNDGMNRVGIDGRGESVWLGWFLCTLVQDFAPVAHARGDTERAKRWQSAAQGWKNALLTTAWDGQWFTRAYFDDGQPLGAQANPEARIDLIAQAWAVLSHVAPPPVQHQVMAAVETHLVDHEAGLIRLLDPPLAHARPSAGYIQAYPPGVRENGGQYCHAGVWAVMAAAQLTQGNKDTPYRYFTYLSPAHRAAHPARAGAYGLEPYVMAGDIYSQPPYVGRGGWSWYTGSAAWMHRAAIGSILGLQQDATTLRFTPCLPSHWPRAELTLNRDGRSLRFVLLRTRAATALAQAGLADAQLLLMGQALAWHEAPAQACYVIPLLTD